MSKENYIEQTLQMPEQMPLFNYGINFDGLRNVIQEVNILTNDNTNSIQSVQKALTLKLQISSFQQLKNMLDGSFNFGTSTLEFIQSKQTTASRGTRKHLKDMSVQERFCWKINQMASLLENLLIRTTDIEHNLANDHNNHQTGLEDAVNRLQDKINSSSDTITKTINHYFQRNDQHVTALDSDIKTHKLDFKNAVKDLQREIQAKVGEISLKGAMDASELKIKKDIQSQIEADQMKRLAIVNDLNHKMKQHQGDVDLRIKSMRQRVQQCSDKVAKSLTTAAFEVEKHKIFEKLAEFRNKIDELFRKNGQIMDFRKSSMMTTEKVKQDVIGIQQEVKKLQEKQGSFKRMQNIAEVLEALDPHLICTLDNEIKLHEKEIGRLAKLVLSLERDLAQSTHTSKKEMPEVNFGQNSDLIQKIIREYMSNMDFEGRVKKGERDIQELNKKNDLVHELQKKVYLLNKEMDMGVIMKELRKKCDEQNTRKDNKILDTKVEQLFSYFKQIRKDTDDLAKRSAKPPSKSIDNYSLTTKKLYATGCLSCTPSRKKNFSRQICDLSLDQPQQLRNTVYSKIRK